MYVYIIQTSKKQPQLLDPVRNGDNDDNNNHNNNSRKTTTTTTIFSYWADKDIASLYLHPFHPSKTDLLSGVSMCVNRHLLLQRRTVIKTKSINFEYVTSFIKIWSHNVTGWCDVVTQMITITSISRYAFSVYIKIRVVSVYNII